MGDLKVDEGDIYDEFKILNNFITATLDGMKPKLTNKDKNTIAQNLQGSMTYFAPAQRENLGKDLTSAPKAKASPSKGGS